MFVLAFVCFLVTNFQVLASSKSKEVPVASSTSETADVQKTETIDRISEEAAAGKADAQYYLGCMLRDGRGVKKDPEAAKEWFLKAGKQGHQKGQIAFNQLYTEIELKKPGVSNVVRPVDVVQQGILFLALTKAGFSQNLDDIKAPPFHFGLPYKVDDKSSLLKGLGTVRNPDILWLYNPDNDEEFMKFKAQVITELVKEDLPRILKEIKEVQADKEKSQKVIYEKFVEALKKIGAKREEIAQKLKSKNAEEFGAWRMPPYNDLHTPLSPEDSVRGRYQPWARHVKETVYKLAKTLIDNPDMEVTPWVEFNAPDSSIRSRVKLSLFLKHDYQIINKYHVDKLQTACVNHWPQNYADFFEPAAFVAEDGVRFLVLTMEIGAGDHFVPTTRISGLFKPDKSQSNGFSQKALASFLTSPLIAEHLDRRNIDTLLEMCSTCWFQALTWDGKDLQKLLNNLATLQYCLDNASPFKRGSAWVSEVLIEAIVNFHGHDIFLKPGTISMVQVALGVPLDEHIALYPKMVDILKQTEGVGIKA